MIFGAFQVRHYRPIERDLCHGMSHGSQSAHHPFGAPDKLMFYVLAQLAGIELLTINTGRPGILKSKTIQVAANFLLLQPYRLWV